MIRKFLFIFLIILLFIPGWTKGISSKVKSFTLSNGMRFLIYEKHQIPTFAGLIMAKVGSVDEREGETGLAHFFEHLASKGTPVIGTKNFQKEKEILDKMDVIGDQLAAEFLKGRQADQKKLSMFRKQLKEMQKDALQYVVKDEFVKIYHENGGKNRNASTSTDTTRYYLMLPSNRLELWFLMESERFKHPVLREFYSERDVVAEERRMFEENDPVGVLLEEISNLAFRVNPYRHSVLGYMEDIQSYTKDKAFSFYKRFYNPSNMVAVIVGDVKFNEAKSLAKKYFGDIPRGSDPPSPIFVEPEQRGERRTKIFYDAQPRIIIGYHMPGFQERENVVLRLIASILSEGDSSRFRKDLINKKKIAVTTFAFANALGSRYPSLFGIYALPRKPHTNQEVEIAVYEHLEHLKNEPVSKKELTKVINQAEAMLHYSSGYAENLFLSFRIARNILLHNDMDYEVKIVEEMKTVTPKEIMETAKRIFVKNNRIVAVQEEKKGGIK